MSPVRKILEEVNWGISPEVLAKKHPWEELSAQEPEELLNFARYQNDSQQSYNLLVYLFRISRGQDLWFSVEVLSQALQHPAMSSEDRNTILRTMRNRLDRIKDEVRARTPPEEKIRKYWLLEASYYAIYGATLAENDRNEEAVENYQIAEGIFQQLGLKQQADNLSHKIEFLTSIEKKTTSAPNKPTVQTPSPHSSPLSANFRGTTELSSAALVLSEQKPVPPPEPALAAANRQLKAQETRSAPSAKAPGSAELKPSPGPAPAVKEPTPQANPPVLPSQPPVALPAPPSSPAKPADFAEHPTNLSSGLPEPINPVQNQVEAAKSSLNTSAGREEKAAPHEASVGQPEKNAELVRLADEIREQSELLVAIELDIHIYQERRIVLFHEVQSLEKRAVYLKELYQRLERKSKKLDNNT